MRRFAIALALACLFAGAAYTAASAASDQPNDDTVGVIEGDDILINGPMNVESVGGQIKTVLRSGSDVRLKSGQARISLVEGGQVSICAPAHLSVLKAGGALTIALDSGVIHVWLDQTPALTVYTAQIQAKPIPVGDEPRDLLMGFESSGLMCVRPYRGAIRVEQQLTGESIVIPQGGDVSLTNGQIDSLRNNDGEGHCHCELQIAKAQAPAPPKPKQAPPTPSQSAVANSEDAQSAQSMQSIQSVERAESAMSSAAPTPAPEKRAGNNDLVYQVDLPPLRYDATAKIQPAPDPRLMVIVRKIRVRPTLIFQGRVEEPPATVAAATPPPPQPATAPTPNPAQPAKEPGVVDRVRSFFRRLLSKSG